LKKTRSLLKKIHQLKVIYSRSVGLEDDFVVRYDCILREFFPFEKLL